MICQHTSDTTNKDFPLPMYARNAGIGGSRDCSRYLVSIVETGEGQSCRITLFVELLNLRKNSGEGGSRKSVIPKKGLSFSSDEKTWSVYGRPIAFTPYPHK